MTTKQMAACGKTIHSEAREVVNHVISCVNKKQPRKVLFYLFVVRTKEHQSTVVY